MATVVQDSFESIPYDEIAGAAYRLATDGAVTHPSAWQVELYKRLSDSNSEAGLLLLAPPGAGKLDAVIIPSLGIKRGGAPRRLFLIAREGSPLDDYVYRYAPLLRNWAASDGTDRTIFVDGDESEMGSRFYSDGREEPNLAVNPLEADVDLVLVTLDRFENLFFGAGGVHAMPTALSSPDAPRRDLFLFDDAHEYGQTGFSGFRRLVEFLFAEDFDVIVSTSIMPPAFQEEMSFLEVLHVGREEGTGDPQRTLAYSPGETIGSALARAMAASGGSEQALAIAASGAERIIAVAENVSDAQRLHAEREAAVLYHEAIPQSERRAVYSDLMEREDRGEGYVVITTACALESSDLDASVLITGLCPPENLLRRAGRLNRHGQFAASRLQVCGTALPDDTRAMNEVQRDAYVSALRNADGQPFHPDDWVAFI
jgi:CRISPR-associated endonuclease/helicase Cas3